MEEPTSNSDYVLKIQDGLTAKINSLNEQLYSLAKGKEYMWGGGTPEKLKRPEENPEAGGWQNSEIIMFPIVGPVKDNQITVDGLQYPMGQHGIARYIKNELKSQFNDRVIFKQIYTAKSPVKSPKGEFSFPFSYELEKQYRLKDDSLEFVIKVKNTSDKPMPYAIGWHPAFRIFGDESDIYIQTKTDKHPLSKIKELSKTSALILPGTKELKYVSGNTEIGVSSTLEHTMIWSPCDQPFICIEPISVLPDSEHAGELRQKLGYQILKPNRSKTCTIIIKPK